MKLYSYFRSSAAYRVRIALNLKGLPYETVAVHLLRQGGEQLLPEYRRLNPTALVPTLVNPEAELGVDIRGRREIFQLTPPPFVDPSVKES